MRVVLDTSAASRPGADRGLGRYLRAVRDANASANNEVRELRFRIGTGRLSEFWPLVNRSIQVARSRGDIFHAVTPYYIAPGAAHQVVSVLDLIPLDVHAPGGTGIKTTIFHRLAARASVIVTLSEHAKQRIADRLNVSAQRIVVAALPSVLTRSGPDRLDLPERYIVALADLRTPDPRKRTEWLEGIARQLHARGIPLVIAGPGTDAACERFPGARALGRLDDPSLAELLGRARALVYTSAYEGQGLPPLEAIRLGAPVIGMRNTSIPEVVGDAGILLDEELPPAQAARGPHRADAPAVTRLVNACCEVFEDDRLHARLVAACTSRDHLFTPEAFRDNLQRAYELARTGPAR